MADGAFGGQKQFATAEVKGVGAFCGYHCEFSWYWV